jgi:hypothetical protein
MADPQLTNLCFLFLDWLNKKKEHLPPKHHAMVAEKIDP